MLNLLIDGNVISWVGVCKQFFLVGVCISGVYITEFTKTVSWTILQYIYNTAGTYVFTSSTLITTESELRIKLDREVFTHFDIGLKVDVRATNA